jgi:hypothetical protein
VDGFDDDESEGERNKGAEVSRGLLAAERNALEAFELADRLLDARARPIERLRKESRPVLLIGLVRNHRGDATLARRRTVALSGVSLVAHRGTGRDVRSKIKQGLELRAVARLTAREVEGQRQAIEVDLEVNFGREAAARAPERLAVLPPFAPAAETCARTTVESNIGTRWAVRLKAASASKKASNTPARLRRQKRFQMLFQGPNSAGSARQVMLWSVK